MGQSHPVKNTSEAQPRPLLGVFCHFQGSLEKCPTTSPHKTYCGLKQHKPGINGQVAMAPTAVADDVKWMYLYIHK